MWIEDRYVLCEDFKLRRGRVRVEDGRIREVIGGDVVSLEEVRAAEGEILIPGLIDLHFHGALGEDFCDARMDGMRKIAEFEFQNGITGICPATLTLSEEELCEILRTIASWKKQQRIGEAEVLGINMEGPFISPIKKGAQNERYIRHCDITLAERFLAESEGLVRFIGLAPEENPDYPEFVAALKDRVQISLAHSNADFKCAGEAFQAGVSHAVHLYNAMTGLHHRDPGAVGAVFENPAVTAELIADGIHVHPFMVKLAFKLLGPDRMILISDSLRSAGMPDGSYLLGGQEIEKRGPLCTLVSDGNIAGSSSSLMDCVRTAVLDMKIPFGEVIRAASRNPAKCLNADSDLGSIAPGKRADLVLLDAELKVKQVWKSGKSVFTAEN